MRGNTGKNVFIGALALCLALMCALCWNGVRRADSSVASPALENETLVLRVGEDGLVVVEGEGPLSSRDMDALLRANGIRTRQLNDLILGDGITELGYNAINGYTYLRTLKLGAGMSVVENGAVKSCTALEYVFLPDTVRRLGRDFLYRSDLALVITDGMASALPKLEQVLPEHVLGGVDSFDTLARRCAELQPGGAAREVPEACRLWWE